MNATAIALGTAAIQDRAYFEETRAKIIATRERTKQRMRELGFTFGDSKANFLFVTHPSLDAEKLFQALKEAGIYVRYFKKPRIDPVPAHHDRNRCGDGCAACVFRALNLLRRDPR